MLEVDAMSAPELSALLDLLHEHETDHHDGPFTVPRALAVVRELAAAREALWDSYGRFEGLEGAAQKAPRDLARMCWEASRARQDEMAAACGGSVLAPEWDALPLPVREVLVASASDVIDALIRGDS
jgi:hypothetical protein